QPAEPEPVRLEVGLARADERLFHAVERLVVDAFLRNLRAALECGLDELVDARRIAAEADAERTLLIRRSRDAAARGDAVDATHVLAHRFAQLDRQDLTEDQHVAIV